jgi:hypothetical protein
MGLSAATNPTISILIAECEDVARARQLFMSAEFREATQRAGLTAPPEVTMADQVQQVPAYLGHASAMARAVHFPEPTPNRAGPRAGRLTTRWTPLRFASRRILEGPGSFGRSCPARRLAPVRCHLWTGGSSRIRWTSRRSRRQ